MTTGIGRDIAKEEASRQIVMIVMIIIWILVFEGAVRKWFFPALSKPLVFIKDPLVLYAYYIAAKNRLFPMNSLLLKAAFVLMILFAVLGVIQNVGIGLPLPVALYGWRQYWLVLPLAFLIGEFFTGKDLHRLIKHYLIMTSVNGILVFFQSRSPPTAWINQTHMQEGTAFTYGAEGLPRASGTFSFTNGHEIFTASAVPLLLTLWLVPASQRGVRPIWLWIASVLAMINVLLDGNRHVFVHVAWSLVACIPGYWILKNRKLRIRAITLPLVACLIGGIMYTTMFSQAFQNMKARVTETEDSYDPLERLLWGPFRDVPQALQQSSMLGEGLGLGSSGAQTATAGFRANAVPYEMEWPRVVCETGVMGILYMLYRVVFSVVLLVNALPAAIRSSNILPLMLVSFVLQIVPWAPMSGNATCVYFGWLFAGFSLAANKMHAATRGER